VRQGPLNNAVPLGAHAARSGARTDESAPTHAARTCFIFHSIGATHEFVVSSAPIAVTAAVTAADFPAVTTTGNSLTRRRFAFCNRV
jgi:hypothetical protein